jgi:RHS repeat-associated protein
MTSLKDSNMAHFPLRNAVCALALAITLGNQAQADSAVNYTYTTLGQVATVDGPRTDVSDITRYAYDAQGNLTTVTNALGQVTTLANFDAYGHAQTVTDPNGVVATLTYTPEGWLASSAIGSATTAYSYNAVGDVLQITYADGNTLSFTYDDARRLIAIRNRLGESIRYTLDAMGNRTVERVLDSSSTLVKQQRQTFDELGRLIKSVGDGSQTQRYGYDLNDNRNSSTTPRSNKTLKSFDGLNRVTKVTDPLGGATALSYNADDQITKVVDPRGVTTQYTYDILGNVTKRVSPDTGTATFVYDTAGNMTSSTDARGVITNYTYDALNRLTAKTFPATPALNVTFAYDQTTNGNKGIGRLTRLQDSGGTLSYTYDAQGNLVSQIRTLPVSSTTATDTLTYSYDAANNLSQLGYGMGISTAYTRNSAAQVTGIKLTVGTKTVTLANAITYQPFGPLKTLTWGNGVALTRTYDTDYQLSSQTTGSWKSTYSFDLDGNISQVSHSLWGAAQYQYDTLGRLSQEQTSSTLKGYILDATGNRTKRVTTATASNTVTDTQSLTYASDSNRLTAVNGLALTYDAAGNQVQRDGLRYTYDNQGRLSEVYQATTQKVADYKYNALGQRTLKRVFDPSSQALLTTTTFLYGQGGKALGQTVYNAAGVKTSGQYWLWLDGMPLGQLNATFASDGTISSNNLVFLHPDHLNTPRLATNSAQTLVWSWNSDAYGVGAPNEDVDGDGKAMTVALRFPGQVYDATSQLSYNYYRDYNAETGRYVQSDPIGLRGGINTYNYVLGNPIKYSDIKGLATTVFITKDFGIGSHAAVYTDRGDAGGPALYDPAGSYMTNERGTGDLFFENQADRQNYTAYQLSTGSSLETYTINTTAAEEKSIIQAADAQGGGSPGQCAALTSSALNGVGPFEKLGSFIRPGSLADALSRIPTVIKSEGR